MWGGGGFDPLLNDYLLCLENCHPTKTHFKSLASITHRDFLILQSILSPTWKVSEISGRFANICKPYHWDERTSSFNNTWCIQNFSHTNLTTMDILGRWSRFSVAFPSSISPPIGESVNSMWSPKHSIGGHTCFSTLRTTNRFLWTSWLHVRRILRERWLLGKQSLYSQTYWRTKNTFGRPGEGVVSSICCCSCIFFDNGWMHIRWINHFLNDLETLHQIIKYLSWLGSHWNVSSFSASDTAIFCWENNKRKQFN